MTKFKVGIIINKPTEIVVKALMNPNNFHYWQTDLERFEIIKLKPGMVSSIGHLHYSQKGHSYILEDKMIYCEPGKKYVSQVTGDVIEAQVATTLNSIDNKTEMSISWSGKGKNILTKLLLPLSRKKNDRAI